MHLVLHSEHYDTVETEPRACDWCGKDIPIGDTVWVVTVTETALPVQEATRTLDICVECSIAGSPEKLYT